MRKVTLVSAFLGAVATAYALVVRGSVTIDLGIGRVLRPLGPLEVDIAAPPETVFDVIAAPYLGKTPHALQQKLEVWERGGDMVLAAHHTRVRGLIATTLETVRFERPSRIDFRLVRGPVPHVVESFDLRPSDAGTALTWTGELGTDLWALGRWWGDRVARVWTHAVSVSFSAVKQEAERRAS